MRKVLFMLLVSILIIGITAAGCGNGESPGTATPTQTQTPLPSPTPVATLTPTATPDGSPGVEWENTFGGSGDERGMSVKQTSDGGYIIAGWTQSYGAGEYDCWLIKTDGAGEEQWSNTFGGPDNDVAWAVQQTSDGGYIVGGWTWSYGAGEGDFWLVKTDENGEEEWSNTFGGVASDEAHSVQQTSDGGYILAGVTRSYGSGGGDFWLVKTDENGEEEWNNTFGGFGGEIAFSVRQTSDGGYVLVGWMESDDEGMGDSLLVKADEMGDQEWSMAFSGAAFDVGRSVQQTSDGGYIFAGHTESYSAREYDYWLVKVDELGNGEWNKAFGGTDYEEAYFVQQTSDDGYIIAGKTKSFGEGGYDFWLVKTDEEGNKEWSKTLGDFREDVANSVQQTSDGGYIVVGWTESQGAGKKDCWVVKLK